MYIGESLWQSYDGYAASSGERTVHIQLTESGTYTLEIRNRPDRNPLATDGSTYRVQFKQVQVLSTDYTAQTILYTYDKLARLLLADYYAGTDLQATPTRAYEYAYDRAGNRTGREVHIGGVQDSDLTYTYNVANQLVYDGTNTLTYDDSGNLTSDGVNSYTWDRANRLLSVGSASYQYDGVGNRIRQTVSSIVTDYLNDVPPGLTKLLAQTTGATTDRFIHAPRGIHAMEDNSGNWTYPVQDGLGSVRGVVSDALAMNGIRHYSPDGNPFGAQSSLGMDFGFTGEQTDGSGQIFLRARYYDPGIGVFTALDPVEGTYDRPMSLNGYLYVEGNTPNATDPSGKIPGLSTDFADRFMPPFKCNGIMGCPGSPEREFAKDIESFSHWVYDRARIIPELMVQDPINTLRALQQFINCGDAGIFLREVARELPPPLIILRERKPHLVVLEKPKRGITPYDPTPYIIIVALSTVAIGGMVILWDMYQKEKASQPEPAIDLDRFKDKDDEEKKRPAYRLGNTNARNLTPRPDKDIPSGLSLTITQPTQKAWLFRDGKQGIELIGFEVEDAATDNDPGHFHLRPGLEHISKGWTLVGWAETRHDLDNENPETWHPLTKLLLSIAEVYP